MIALFPASLALLAFSETACAADAKKPNVVLILADNVSYGNLGSFGTVKPMAGTETIAAQATFTASEAGAKGRVVFGFLELQWRVI